jgi:hypothetical protein
MNAKPLYRIAMVDQYWQNKCNEYGQEYLKSKIRIEFEWILPSKLGGQSGGIVNWKGKTCSPAGIS